MIQGQREALERANAANAARIAQEVEVAQNRPGVLNTIIGMLGGSSAAQAIDVEPAVEVVRVATLDEVIAARRDISPQVDLNTATTLPELPNDTTGLTAEGYYDYSIQPTTSEIASLSDNRRKAYRAMNAYFQRYGDDDDFLLFFFSRGANYNTLSWKQQIVIKVLLEMKNLMFDYNETTFSTDTGPDVLEKVFLKYEDVIKKTIDERHRDKVPTYSQDGLNLRVIIYMAEKFGFIDPGY